MQQQRESGVYIRAACGELLAARGVCQSIERQAVRKTREIVFVSLLWPCPVFCIGAFCARSNFFICKLFISKIMEQRQQQYIECSSVVFYSFRWVTIMSMHSITVRHLQVFSAISVPLTSAIIMPSVLNLHHQAKRSAH